MLVVGVPAKAGKAAIAALRRWEALAADDPQAMGRLLDADDFTITKELEIAASFETDDEYGLEGDGAVVVQSRYLWY